MRHISIYWDESQPGDHGWSYHISGGGSGAINGRAAAAVDRIVTFSEPVDGDRDAILAAIEWEPGDHVTIDGPGLPGPLGDLLEDRK